MTIKKEIKPNFKKVSDEELERIKQDIRIKLKKERDNDNLYLILYFILYLGQAILFFYAMYRVFSS